MKRGALLWASLAALVCGMLAVVPDASGARSAHFVASADFGARASTRTVLADMAAQNATAALAVGDLAYRDAVPETAWCAYVKQFFAEGFPFQLVSGNHESLDVGDGMISAYADCLPNQVPGMVGDYGREYYMDFPSSDPLVRVIAVSPLLTFDDGQWLYNQGDAHYQWLSDAIDSGREAGATWIIVAAHIPCWSVGKYSCRQTDFYNLLLQKHVDLVLSGHEHSYARTHQLAQGTPGCTAIAAGSYDPDCVRDRDSAFTAGQGTVFATVGTGGIPLRDVNPGDSEAGYFASYSGANRNPSYGYLDIDVQESTLSARFLTTSGGPFTDWFSITTAAGNQPPVASFTVAADGLKASVDGTASSDPDGTISAYEWDFGDGSPSVAAPTASHTYAAAGTYHVTLTVTDDAGSSAQLAQHVAVGAVLASDTFTRSVTAGWGSAEVGGTYKVSGTKSNYSVDGSAGVLSLVPGSSRRTTLSSPSPAAADVRATFGLTGSLSGGGISASLLPRVKPDSSAYRAKVVVSGKGEARLSLTRMTATGADVALATATGALTGVSSSKRIVVRTQAAGSFPTTLRAKMWFEGTPEPTAWAVQTTDSTGALQGSGAVGVFVYESRSALSPVAVRVDELKVTAP